MLTNLKLQRVVMEVLEDVTIHARCALKQILVGKKFYKKNVNQ